MSDMIKNNEAYFKNAIMKELEKYKKLKWDLDELNSQDKILYSTFGFHAGEPPYSIVSRKLVELEENKFALWGARGQGATIKNIKDFCEARENGEDKDVKTVKAFCEARDNGTYKFKKKPANDIYLLLTFTRNLSELEKKCSNIEQANDGRNFCSDSKCNKCNIPWTFDKNDPQLYKTSDFKDAPNLIEKNIFVKGDDGKNENDGQNKAFLVVDFFFIDNLDTVFYRPRKDQKPKTLYYNSFDEKFFSRSTSILERNKNDIKQMKGENWGLVLKLKAPYIVTCYR